MSEISHEKNNLPVAVEFFGKIKASWNKAVSSILESAQTLNDAEGQLSKREFRQLRDQLQQGRVMSAATITKLRKIGASAVLTAPENMLLLPPSYNTLYQISKYAPQDVQTALDDRKLSSTTQLKDLKDILPAPKVKKMTATSKVERVSMSVRFSEKKGVIPQDLLVKLEAVLKEIEAYTDVKVTGGSE